MDDDPPELFTPSHMKATDEVGDILDKYFDGWVLVTRVVSDVGKRDVIHYSFNNGQAEAMGLMELAKHYHGKVGMTLFDLAGVMWENADYGTGLIGGQDYEKLKVLPVNLVKAKMRRLIKRGLVHGCACGCRGDFTLTVKGKKEINNIQ